MVANKTFIHRKVIPGRGSIIPDTLMTIQYQPWYRLFEDAYDFVIERLTIYTIHNNKADQLIFDQLNGDNLNDESFQTAFHILLEDGIVHDLMGNHHRFYISECFYD